MATGIAIPDEVSQVLEHFRTCELSTISRDGTPNTWPVGALWIPEKSQFILSTSIGAPYKALHIRRNSRVSLFFSEPFACGLQNPPLVLVQGDAQAPDEIHTSFSANPDYRAWMKRVYSLQPAGKLYSSNAVMRYLFDWYYMRLVIAVTPRRILWWPGGDQSQPAQTVEVA